MSTLLGDALSDAGFTILDVIALFVFFASWKIHFWIVNKSPWRHKTISAKMSMFRQRWMNAMVYRELKMPDAIIQNTLQYGVLFFASTSILLIGALMAGFGASDQAIAMLGDLPFAVNTTRTVWEVKVLLVALIFTFAFFKFTWSYRLFNYVLIMIGAAPDLAVAAVKGVEDPVDPEDYGSRVAQLHTLGARHFTTGLNAYFFALAACTWFLSPVLFIAATIWISLVLYRRAFWSTFARILSGIDGIDS